MVATYEMNDSGVEWIGQMPKGWEIISFKYTHNGANVGIAIDKEFWSLNESDTVFYTAGLKPINTCYNSIDSRFLTKENDLLLARNGTPYVYSPQEKAIYTDHIIRVSIKSGCNKTFIKYCLQQSITNEVVDTVSIATWSVSIWNRQYLPLPPLPEQTAIASYLDDKCSAIDDVIAQAKETIEEYKSWKASVIFEAVTKGLDPNVEMKDSSVEWIGKIPKHWNTCKLKYLCSMQAGKNLTSEDIHDIDKYPVYGGNGLRGYYKSYNVDTPCILVGRQGALCGNIHLVSGKFWATEHAVVTIESKLMLLDNLYYLLIGMNLNKYASDTAAQPGLSVTIIQNVMTTFAPLDEQKPIAKFLKKQCSAIDSIISEKQVLIDELESYKKSLIFETVTGKRRVC